MNIINDGDFLAIHLNNGTTVITKLVSSTEDDLLCSTPMELVTKFTQEGPRPGLEPFLSHGGVFPPLETVPISYADIFFIRPVPEHLESFYREITGMVAVPARQSLIVPA